MNEDRSVYEEADYAGPTDQRILRPDDMTVLEMVDKYHSGLLSNYTEPQNVSTLLHHLIQMHLQLSYINIKLLCTICNLLVSSTLVPVLGDTVIAALVQTSVLEW